MTEESKDIVKLEVIPPDQKITITVDTDLYIRIQKCLLEALPFKDFEHFQKCVKEVIAGKLEDPLSQHAYTLILLCNMIEEAAKKENLIKITSVDLKTGKPIES